MNVAACPKCEGTGRNSMGGNFRNFSHLFDAGADVPYVNASKGEKPVILAWLRATKKGRWFAAIADSGQKQVLPYAPINLPASRGRVIFDDTIVLLPDARGWAMADDMGALLTAGATKEEISRGSYGPCAWTRCRLPIEAFESQWRQHRGGAFFSFALWLSQRDEMVVQARMVEERSTAAAKKVAKRHVAQGSTAGRRR